MKSYPSPPGGSRRRASPSWAWWPLSACSHVCGLPSRGKMSGTMEKQGWGLGGIGFSGREKYGQQHEIRASGDGCSLDESRSPVLLTWRFVAVMNILPGIVEASLGCSVFRLSSTQGRLHDSTDGWLGPFFFLFFFCSPALHFDEIHCLCNRGFMVHWRGIYNLLSVHSGDTSAPWKIILRYNC